MPFWLGDVAPLSARHSTFKGVSVNHDAFSGLNAHRNPSYGWGNEINTGAVGVEFATGGRHKANECSPKERST